MGWFSNDKKEEAKKLPSRPIQELPTLPELPKLPELPSLPDTDEKEPIHQLPSFPNNPLGEKFSQDTIKDAVTGKKEGDEEGADESDNDEQMIPAPPIHNMTSEPSPYNKPNQYRIKSRTEEAEPIFVRIDKFEESLDIFQKTKEKISDIDEMLREIKKIKEEEEEQLNAWEKEIQKVKEQIGKIDQELFSKL